MWYVYMLRCPDDSLYIGETRNLRSRLLQHSEGTGSRFTARRRPVTLAYSERYPNRPTAPRRERQLKHWTRVKKEALVAGDLELLKRL